jgi:hypothetical protein
MTKEDIISIVQLGCHVEIELVFRTGKRENLGFDLVPDWQADYQNGFVGMSAPIADAIIGERCGYLIPFFTEEFQAIQILSIKKSNRKPEGNIPVSRKASIQEILKQIEFRDAVLFASSTDTKWGSYDADSLDYAKWKEDDSIRKPDASK